jgi:hypothetical protein
MFIDLIFLHEKNALLAIFSIVFGIIKYFSFLQYANAFSSILIIYEFKLTFSRFLHPKKKHSGIQFIFSGIEISEILS